MFYTIYDAVLILYSECDVALINFTDKWTPRYHMNIETQTYFVFGFMEENTCATLT